MNTPFSSHAWRELQARAAAQLRPDFAGHVLYTSHHAAVYSPFRVWASSPFAVSTATAGLCLFVVVFIHAQLTQAASVQHLADWQEISVQTASLDINP